MTEPEEPKPKAWEYPLKRWPREEKFWFDIFTRTISAVVAALIVFATARLAGYFSTVAWSSVFKAVFTSSATIAVITTGLAFVVSFFSHRSNRETRDEIRDSVRRQLDMLTPEEQEDLFRRIQEAIWGGEVKPPWWKRWRRKPPPETDPPSSPS